MWPSVQNHWPPCHWQRNLKLTLNNDLVLAVSKLFHTCPHLTIVILLSVNIGIKQNNGFICWCNSFWSIEILFSQIKPILVIQSLLLIMPHHVHSMYPLLCSAVKWWFSLVSSVLLCWELFIYFQQPIRLLCFLLIFGLVSYCKDVQVLIKNYPNDYNNEC